MEVYCLPVGRQEILGPLGNLLQQWEDPYEDPKDAGGGDFL